MWLAVKSWGTLLSPVQKHVSKEARGESEHRQRCGLVWVRHTSCLGQSSPGAQLQLRWLAHPLWRVHTKVQTQGSCHNSHQHWHFSKSALNLSQSPARLENPFLEAKDKCRNQTNPNWPVEQLIFYKVLMHTNSLLALHSILNQDVL